MNVFMVHCEQMVSYLQYSNYDTGAAAATVAAWLRRNDYDLNGKKGKNKSF